MFNDENDDIIKEDACKKDEKRKYIFLFSEGNKPLKVEEFNIIKQRF
jgi:hypothetical protein